MIEEKEDGRIIRSKRDLANALIELLQEKNYDDIGIKEITDKARVSKNTFYNNFKDKNELLGFVFQRYEDALFEEIRPLRKSFFPIARLLFLRKTVKKITHFFCSRETLPFKKRVDNDNSRSIYYRLSLFILHLINRLDKESNGMLYKGTEEEKQIKATFYSGAFAALLYSFFKNSGQLKENELSKIIRRLAAPARE
mgnify:CR=1 FL=1